MQTLKAMWAPLLAFLSAVLIALPAFAQQERGDPPLANGMVTGTGR